ncbi:MAG: hypothetical protein KJ072_14530 [Verrucomicrobia bacterium]|nr:hypothetical protein [Verrucomicrobiota bacterium]
MKATLLLLLGALPISGGAADATLMALGKGVEYRQTSASAPVLADADPYHFFVTVEERETGSVAAATFSKPNGTTLALAREGSELVFGQTFSSQSALNTAFPSHGTTPYRLRLATTHDGDPEIALLLKSASLPNAPRLSNYTQAQAVDPSLPFTLTWTTFQNATTNDATLVEITTAYGDVYFSGLPGEPGALNGKATSLTLPANTFETGRRYDLSITFARIVARNETDYPGATGYALYTAETSTTLKALGSSPWPESAALRFDCAHDPGILPATGTGTVTPSFFNPLSLRFNLYFTVVDSNPRPESVMFHGPVGSGIDEVPSAGYWDFLGPTTRLYFMTERPIPPYPSGGLYRVDYSTLEFAYAQPDPEMQTRQIRVRPFITVTGGSFNTVNWDYEDLDGNPTATPAYFSSLTLRLDGDAGQFFHQDGLPLEPRSKKLPSAIPWSGLRNVTFVLRDNLGNSYLSPSRKWDFPAITTLTLPKAEQSTPYSTTLSAGGGTPPYTWSPLESHPPPEWLNVSPAGHLEAPSPKPGDYQFTIHLVDALGHGADQWYALAVQALPPTNYLHWCAAHFTETELGDPDFSGKLADPENDQRVNLLEYALGSSPKNHDPTPPLACLLEPQGLILSHSRNTLAQDIQLELQVAEHLIPAPAWNSIDQVLSTSEFSQVPDPPDEHGVQLDRFILSLPLNHRELFFRLDVQERAL